MERFLRPVFVDVQREQDAQPVKAAFRIHQSSGLCRDACKRPAKQALQPFTGPEPEKLQRFHTYRNSFKAVWVCFRRSKSAGQTASRRSCCPQGVQRLRQPK